MTVAEELSALVTYDKRLAGAATEIGLTVAAPPERLKAPCARVCRVSRATKCGIRTMAVVYQPREFTFTATLTGDQHLYVPSRTGHNLCMTTVRLAGGSHDPGKGAARR